ncbi:unnamed protein product [Blepharisma stoltei]|uniref:14-3-3 domain-containing protein n=1 Tax=Blepharisma stoltei TaxID=1481888 RepID=A0AAU9JQK5_9CILI|nr:unnamed protein product [Blepharisma stoltei]
MQREEFSYNAKLAEHSERYGDMIASMKSLIDEANGDINNEERTLLSVAYKQAVGERRNAYRIISSYEQKQKSRGQGNLEITQEYKEKINKELHALCSEIICLIDQKLLRDSDPDDIKLFYIKMKADYYRYMSESGDAAAVESSNEAYQQASDVAKNLPANNPIRIGLALNYSVFKYEVLKETAQAIELAKSAFDEALPQLDDLDERAYKEATSILGLIKDNLALWTSEEEAD